MKPKDGTVLLPAVIVIFLIRAFRCSAHLNEQTVFHTDSGKVESLTVSKDGSIYVVTSDLLMQFHNESVSRDFLSSEVHIVGRTSVLMLLNYTNEEYLLRCNFTDCSTHDSSNISQFWQTQMWIEPLTGNSSNGEHLAQLVFVPCESKYCYMYSAINSIGHIETFSERLYYFQANNDKFVFSHRNSDVRNNYIKAKPAIEFEYIFSFHSSGFVYFLRNTLTTDGGRIAYISQVCHQKVHEYFRSYMESRLECNGYTTLLTATLVQTETGSVLVASFCGTQATKYPGSIVCKYLLKSVENYFKNEQKLCFEGLKGSWPNWIDSPGESCSKKLDKSKIDCGYTEFNTRITFDGSLKNVNSLDSVLMISHEEMVTSTLIMPHQNIYVGYFGTNAGNLKKVLFDSSFVKSIVVFHTSVSNEQGPLRGLAASGDGSKLFYIQDTKITSKLYTLDVGKCNVHSNCYTCLTDVLECVWIQGLNPPTGKCVPRNTEAEQPSLSFDKFCPPQVHDIQPRKGPTGGGTIIQINGILDNIDHYKHKTLDVGVRVTVKIGNSTCRINDTTQFPKRLQCITPPAESPGTFSVSLTVQNSINDSAADIFQPKLSYGEALNKTEFVYVKPVLDQGVSITAKLSGNVQIILRGENLDIGSRRRVTIGQKDCAVTEIDRMTDKEISCLAPKQTYTGNFTVIYEADGSKAIGPVVKCIPDPVIENIYPTSSIVSGGLTLTISGKNLDGFGPNIQLHLGDNNETSTNLSSCEMLSDKKLLCKTAAMESLSPLPILTVPSLFNIYGKMETIEHVRVLIEEDPVMQKEDMIVWVPENVNHTEIKFQGTWLKNLSRDDIKIIIGKTDCSVVEVMEDGVLCVTFDLSSAIFSLKEPVSCTIGNRQYDLGTVAFRRQDGRFTATTTELPDTASAGYDTVIAAVAVIFGMFVVVFVVIGIKKLKAKRANRALDNPYNVYFRRDSNNLTLDGLSESHTSDAMQNRQNDYQQNRFLRAAAQENTFAKETEPLLPVLDENTRTLFEQKNLLISNECLILGEIIGQDGNLAHDFVSLSLYRKGDSKDFSGHFGCVYKGYLTLQNEKAERIVACKTIHRQEPKELDIDMFLKEALLMKDFRHNHVMELVGICLGIDKLPLVVLPFMRKGDVLSFIRDVNNKPTVKELVLFGVDIANGMHYLSQLKFVHRDLAARNCMIDDDMKVKVADFGLSRDVYEKEYYSSCDKKAKLPVKWMSPESLEFGLFTHKSDVWSFGVVLWELLTRGMNPYPTVDNWDILRYLKENRRLNKPDFCPEEMYRIMQHCWSWNPDDRPTFGDLTIKIPELVVKLERASQKRRQLDTSY